MEEVRKELERQAKFMNTVWEEAIPKLYREAGEQGLCIFLRPNWEAITEYEREAHEENGRVFPEEMAQECRKKAKEFEERLISITRKRIGNDAVFVVKTPDEMIQCSAAFVNGMGKENINAYLLGEYTCRCEAYMGQAFSIGSGISAGNVLVLRDKSVDILEFHEVIEQQLHRANGKLIADPESCATKRQKARGWRLGNGQKIDEQGSREAFELKFTQYAVRAIWNAMTHEEQDKLLQE